MKDVLSRFECKLTISMHLIPEVSFSPHFFYNSIVFFFLIVEKAYY